MNDALVTPIAPEVPALLERLQQALLYDGYAYLAADTARWPLSPVVMIRDDRPTLLAIWHPALVEELHAKWHTFSAEVAHAGLLLVGADPVEDEVLQRFLADLSGTVAYVDTGSLQFVVHHGEGEAPLLFAERVLAQYVQWQVVPGDVRIDCRAAMRRLDGRLPEVTIAGQETAPPRAIIPWLTYSFITICTVIFLYIGVRSADIITPMQSELVRWGALTGEGILHGEWWRILTSALLHGSLMHLLFNMFAFYIFGTQLEASQGRWRVFLLFLFSVVAGSLASLWWKPLATSVGASGGLFGLMGAFGALLIRYWGDYPKEQRGEITRWLISLLGYNLAFSMMPGINWAAHVGGLVGGLLLGLVILRSPARPGRLPAWAMAGMLVLVLGLGYFGVYTIERVQQQHRPTFPWQLMEPQSTPMNPFHQGV